MLPGDKVMVRQEYRGWLSELPSFTGTYRGESEHRNMLSPSLIKVHVDGMPEAVSFEKMFWVKIK